jgi:hypothetical protein
MFRADESLAGKTLYVKYGKRTKTAAVSEAMGITGPKTNSLSAEMVNNSPQKGHVNGRREKEI